MRNILGMHLIICNSHQGLTKFQYEHKTLNYRNYIITIRQMSYPLNPSITLSLDPFIGIEIRKLSYIWCFGSVV